MNRYEAQFRLEALARFRQSFKIELDTYGHSITDAVQKAARQYIDQARFTSEDLKNPDIAKDALIFLKKNGVDRHNLNEENIEQLEKLENQSVEKPKTFFEKLKNIFIKKEEMPNTKGGFEIEDHIYGPPTVKAEDLINQQIDSLHIVASHDAEGVRFQDSFFKEISSKELARVMDDQYSWHANEHRPISHKIMENHIIIHGLKPEGFMDLSKDIQDLEKMAQQPTNPLRQLLQKFSKNK